LEANYDNTAGTAAGQATITDARLVFGSAPYEFEWPFVLDPTSSGPVPAGTVTQVMHANAPDPGEEFPGFWPCDYCETQVTLELDLLVDGKNQSLSADANFGCYVLSSSSS